MLTRNAFVGAWRGIWGPKTWVIRCRMRSCCGELPWCPRKRSTLTRESLKWLSCSWLEGPYPCCLCGRSSLMDRIQTCSPFMSMLPPASTSMCLRIRLFIIGKSPARCVVWYLALFYSCLCCFVLFYVSCNMFNGWFVCVCVLVEVLCNVGWFSLM